MATSGQLILRGELAYVAISAFGAQLSLVPRHERLGIRLAATIRYYEKRSLEMGVAIMSESLVRKMYFRKMVQHDQSAKSLSLENLPLHGTT